ncbi:MAG: GNAT family N-acetyltransferase [Chitinophagales bacterium]
MKNTYTFQKTTATDEALKPLKKSCLANLTSPQDDYWAEMRAKAVLWKIVSDDSLIGYACVNSQNKLLQFYVIPTYFSKGTLIFQEFLRQQAIKKALVGTNNPIFLSLALNEVKKIEIDTYLFRMIHDEVSIEEKEGVFRACEMGEIEHFLDFYYDSIEADKAFMSNYLRKYIEQKGIFALEKENQIIGVCELRINPTAPDFVDIGMVVSPEFRKQGYGTYLLNKAKEEALLRGKTPICACDKDNMASFKAISNCGFISTCQLLEIVFK